MSPHFRNMIAAGAVVALTLPALSAMAASGDKRPDTTELEQRRQEQRATMIKALNLGTEQADRVAAVLEDSYTKLQEILDRAKTASRKARKTLRDEVAQLRTDTEAQLKEILSDKQFEQFQKLQSNRQAPGKRAGRGGRGSR